MKGKLPAEFLKQFGIKNISKLDYVEINAITLNYIYLISKKHNFYFKAEARYNKKNWNYEQFPSTINLLEKKDESFVNLKKVIKSFNNWLNIIIEYDKINTVFDDTILAKNQERFYEKFKFLDEEAEYISFDLEETEAINNYLIYTKKRLEWLKKSISKEKIIQILVLEEELELIQKNLTFESKNNIVKRLSKFWGRAQKLGLEVVKEVFVDIIAELSKKLLLGQ